MPKVGFKHSPESRLKMSASKSGRPWSFARRAKHTPARYCLNGHDTSVVGRKKNHACKACSVEHIQGYRSALTPRQNYERNRSLRRLYGLTMNEYQALVVAQDGKCAGCGKAHGDGHYERLCIDHDHDTDDIRGLLCKECNLALGLVKHNPDTLRGLAEYLGKTPIKRIGKSA